MYDHPMGKKKLPTHISERAFALPEQMTEKILPVGGDSGDNKDIKDQEKILNRLNNNVRNYHNNNNNNSGGGGGGGVDNTFQENGDGKFTTSNNDNFSEINSISDYNQSGGGEQHNNNTSQTRTNEGNPNEEEYVFDLDFDADVVLTDDNLN